MQGLNARQREAVTAPGGPVLVLAGPGSGKTRVLTHRISHLLSIGVPPHRILALTFTNKAAREMKERVAAITSEAGAPIWMGTFHSMFARILRIDGSALGYTRSFSIYDTADSLSVVKAVSGAIGQQASRFSPSMLQNRISSAKNRMLTPAECARKAADDLDEMVARVYEAYEKKLRSSNALDFDDLLVKTIELFDLHPAVLAKFSDRFQFLLVDEYQDTNRAQYEILRRLAGTRRNLFVVGDDAQSIYSFRGADIRNILEFERDFPDALLVRLEQNYRSSGKILAAADAVIANNVQAHAKKLWTENEPGEPVRVLSCADDRTEAAEVAALILNAAAGRAEYRETAVMYRTNAQSRVLEDALRRAAIPYRLVGGVEFYQRKEVKDILSYLRLIVNRNDEESFLRIVNVPTRGIGATALERFRAYCGRHGLGLLEGTSHAGRIEGLAARSARAIGDFGTLISGMASLSGTLSAGEFVRVLTDRIGYLRQLADEGTVEAQSRAENVMELLSAVTEFSESRQEADLDVFLQEVALLTGADAGGEEENRVTLLTLHAAKGLEFPWVFITGLEEGLLPFGSEEREGSEIEEERRLFYVGITRAMKELTISWSRVRLRFGELTQQTPSRFLAEIPSEVVSSSSAGVSHGLAQGRWRGGGGRPGDRPGEQQGGFVPRTTRPGRTRRAPERPSGTPPRDLPDLSAGMTVEHGTFGRGKVVEVSYAGELSRAVVDFPGAGRKTLILKYADLKVSQG